MKTQLLLLLFFISISNYGQINKKNEVSQTRSFIKDAETVRINKDWSLIAEFRSGTGETVQFFPIQIVDLKTGNKKNALQVDLQVKTKGLGVAGLALGALAGSAGAVSNNISAVAAGSSLMSQSMTKDGLLSLYVDREQVNEMIIFLEQNILPNLETKYKDKSSEFIFTANEIIFKFLIHEKRKRLSIILNDSDNYEFWTESRAEDIGELVPLLKKVNTKELDF